MLPQPWIVLQSLQAGALLALGLFFLLDAGRRRDAVMGWLAVACLTMALRHGSSVADAGGALDVRGGALLGTLALLCTTLAFRALFPRQMPRALVAGCSLAMIPFALLPLFIQVRAGVLLGGRVLAMAATVVLAVAGLRACLLVSQAGYPYGRRILLGISLALTLMVAALSGSVLFDMDLAVGGIAMLVLALSMALARFWSLSADLQTAMKDAREDAEAWRNLLPGPTWREGETSRDMALRFGEGWSQRLTTRMLAYDGSAYRLHRSVLGDGRSIGWVEALAEDRMGLDASFLRGWQVGLGMDEGEERQRVSLWLEAWGAAITSWGTVPPREGPFPSILIWGREPSILSVWREYDVTRRKVRWIQVGGSRIEGPHAHLEHPLAERAMWEALQSLLSPQPTSQAGSLRP